MHCGNPQEFPLGQCFSTFNKAYHIFYIWNPPWHTRPHKNVTQRRTISRAVMIYSECTHWPPGKGVSRLLLEDSWAWLQHACGDKRDRKSGWMDVPYLVWNLTQFIWIQSYCRGTLACKKNSLSDQSCYWIHSYRSLCQSHSPHWNVLKRQLICFSPPKNTTIFSWHVFKKKNTCHLKM